MDIESLIKKEAPNALTQKHDATYATWLDYYYSIYKHLDVIRLNALHQYAKELYARDGNEHMNVARCIILKNLLDEKRNGGKQKIAVK